MKAMDVCALVSVVALLTMWIVTVRYIYCTAEAELVRGPVEKSRR